MSDTVIIVPRWALELALEGKCWSDEMERALDALRQALTEQNWGLAPTSETTPGGSRDF
jgi:hypothetical protein